MEEDHRLTRAVVEELRDSGMPPSQIRRISKEYQKRRSKVREFEDLQGGAPDQQEQNSDESEVDSHSKPSTVDLTTLNMGR